MKGQVVKRVIIGVALAASAAAFGPIAVYFTPTAAYAFDLVDQNHFKCYSVEGTKLAATVSLVDQFGSVTTPVTEPKFLCNPVDKNGEGIPNPSAHLVCYKIKEEFKQRDVFVSNQFGTDTLKVKDTQLLCVPSTKREDCVSGSPILSTCD